MPNELNTNKIQVSLSANRCRCAVKPVPGASSSRNFRRGEPSPSTLRRPSREKSARKAHKDPVTAEVCTL
ncbi:Hypothetical protein FKW44_018006 [Caligus rogercresseyi]|uniref:Uncharacterized protein n=1 Tax=Caligus rogercresseyi TaxID=217165 RepID=A0A7T8GTS9_CALRO|nr:Hypothetical protein FKW44_018006 [Caligus rogercresseyi]